MKRYFFTTMLLFITGGLHSTFAQTASTGSKFKSALRLLCHTGTHALCLTLAFVHKSGKTWAWFLSRPRAALAPVL